MRRFIKYQVSLLDCFIFVSGLFPVITSIVNGAFLNKILFAVLVAIYILLVFKYGISKRTAIILLLLVMNYFIALLATQMDKLGNTNMFFYYPFMIAYSCFIIDNRRNFIRSLSNNKKFILFIIRLWSVLVGISIFLPSSYYIKEGGAYYFGSFVGEIFRLGPGAIYIMSLVLISMSIYKRKKDFIYMLIPMYCFFMGSSRTYLISGICLFVIGWFWFVGNKKRFYLTIIPIGVVALIILWNSSIGDKIRFTLDDSQYGDFWFRLTSSRSELWIRDLTGWASQEWPNKLFGCGIFYTEQLTGLWAHNDFIEILCSFGLIGVFEYCIVQYILIKSFIKSTNRVPKLLTLCVVMCWLFNAFFNMYYTYFCSLLSYPYVLIAASCFYLKSQEVQQVTFIMDRSKAKYYAKS